MQCTRSGRKIPWVEEAEDVDAGEVDLVEVAVDTAHRLHQ
jgi:hypothetical protein